MEELLKQASELLERWLANSEFADVVRMKQMPSLREDTVKLLDQIPKS